MRGGFLFRVILGVALVAGIIALGAGVYQAGFAAGTASDGAVVAVPPGVYGYGWGWHFGFGIFGFLGFLFFFFLLFGLFRAIAWDGRGWRGGPGGYGRGYRGPGMGPGGDPADRERWNATRNAWLEDWHRQAHGDAPVEGPGGSDAERGTSGSSGR